MFDVVVVGAGLSGLVAAHDLCQHDATLKVKVLEAADRVGGRLLTKRVQVGSGHPLDLDLGGQLIQSNQKNVLQLLDSLKVQTYRLPGQPSSTDNLYSAFWNAGDQRPVIVRPSPWSYGVLGWPIAYLRSLDARYLAYKVGKLAQKIQPRFPYKDKGLASRLDAVTLHTFLERSCYFSSTAAAIELRVRAVFGVESSAISLLFFLTFMISQAAGGWPLTVGRGGAQGICQRLADRLGPGTVMMGRRVTSVEDKDDKVIVTAQNGEQFACRRVICAVPVHLSEKIDFSPRLDGRLRQVLGGFRAGAASKFVAVYERPFWREVGFSGRISCLGGKQVVSTCESMPVTITFDTTYSEATTPADEDGHAILAGFITCQQALDWTHVDPAVLRLSVLDALSEASGGESWPHSVLHFEVKHWWEEDEFCQGCSSPRTGTMRNFHLLRQMHGKVCFAGAETATVWIGSISGAVQSGRRAALHVLTDLRPQTLSSREFAFLAESLVLEEEEEESMTKGLQSNSDPTKTFSVYRWTLVLPMFGLAVGYAAYAFRDRYGALFTPMHH